MNKRPEKVKITQEIIDRLVAERTRTGVSAAALIKGSGDVPEKLNSIIINSWLLGKTGSARKDHLDYAVKAWAALPDKDDLYVQITEDKRQELQTAYEKTGLSPKRLFGNRKDWPDGFNWRNFHSILSRYPKLKNEHFQYIIIVCQENKGKGYKEVTMELRDTINAEIERTGISIPHILRRASRYEKPLVTQITAHNWLNGRVKRADRKAVDYLLNLYHKTPKK